MIHLVIFLTHAGLLAWCSWRLASYGVATWRESVEVVVPIVLEHPASAHYDAGELVAFVARVDMAADQTTMPGPQEHQ